MSHPKPVRRAILGNLLMAGLIVSLLVGGYLKLEPDFAVSWQVVIGLALWLSGIAGLSWGRRWGWYLTLAAATVASLGAMAVGFGLVFFHGAPTPRAMARNPEIFLILGASLLPWAMVRMLLHQDVRQFVRQPRPDGDSGFLPRDVRRRLAVLALIAIVPAGWLAWQPTYVHRSRIDVLEPGYTSNYLRARGLIFPWFVTEVPADLPLHWALRVFPMNLLALYIMAAAPLVALYVAVASTQTTHRGK